MLDLPLSSILHISVHRDGKSKQLIIPIDANIPFPTDIFKKAYCSNQSISLLKHSNLVLTVLSSLTPSEVKEQYAQTLKPVGEL